MQHAGEASVPATYLPGLPAACIDIEEPLDFPDGLQVTAMSD
jgi:hypothetical protein